MTEKTLGELLAETGGSIKTGPFGTVLKAAEYSAGAGVPVISVGEIRYGSLEVRESTPRVAEDVLSRLPDCVLQAGDVVFARKGAVDRSAWLKAAEAGYFLGSDGIRVRFGPAVSSRFIAYQLQTEQLRGWLIKHAAGTTMASLNESILKQAPMEVPTLSEQQAIAEVLESLDEKIGAEKSVVDSADELSRAQFQAVLNEKSQPLSSLARFVNGKAFTKDATGTGRVVVRIAELNSGIGGSTVYNDIDVPEEHLARPGDLLFAWSGSLTVARWYRPEAVVNQHIFKVIPNDGVPMWLVNQAVRSKLEEYKAIAADKATTMGHIQRRHLDEPVTLPDANDTERIDDLMTSLWDVALAAEIASLKAAKTRDELLPLLMSGKIRVRDAERQVEDVL